MTVTGLVTYNVSTSTPWQQAILFILMLLGNISAVSVTMIWVRRHFFRVKFDHAIKNNAAARKKAHDIEEAHHLQRRKGIIRLKQKLGIRHKHSKHRGDEDSDHGNGENIAMHSTSTSSTDRMAEAELQAAKAAKDAKRKEEAKKKRKGPLRTDMIVRIDQPAMLINPMGMPSEGHPVPAPTGENNNSNSSAFGTSGSGGILNTNADAAADDQPGGSQSQQGHGQGPSIRIDLPPDDATGSVRKRFSGTAPMLASLEDSGLMPFTESPVQTRQHSQSDNDGEIDESRRGSIAGNRSTASEDAHPQASGANVSPRTRFTPADPPSARRRRGSDPSAQEAWRHGRRGSESGLNVRYGQLPPQSANGTYWRPGEDRLPRAQTVEFAEPPRTGNADRIFRSGTASNAPDRGYTTGYLPRTATGQTGFARQRTLERTMTGYSGATRGIPLTRTATSAKDRGFGGFPTPLDLAGRGIRAVLPGVRERIMRSTTMPRSATIASTHSLTRMGTQQSLTGAKAAPYLSFDVNVYGNSMFHSLTEAQRDELGGVEYRALDLLAKIVPAYWFGCQMFCVVLVAPYLASSAYNKYRPVFDSQGQYKPDTTWFWFFQVTSAYTNTGMSLIDTSMTQMADAYFPLIAMGFLILVGNTAFPIFLRFWIWLYAKLTPKTSRTYETLRFILDHPRRCFVYLFPSGQTWFLLFIVMTLTMIDWFFFLILDIGNPEIESIPLPQRVFDGLFQSIAVRAAGFQVVGLLSLAPAVQFLYVIMMYISAYPIALSVRSTNVYEERSLGVYTEKKGDPSEDAELPNDASATGWGTYLAAHARRQLAFDIWWLGFALWLVCIIERRDIQDPSSNGWFTVFSCLFELTSAYGTVGLSTGTPTDAFSLSGRFHTLSKLVVIATMLRGRHRGLPVAIDRSILLPTELESQDAADEAWSMVDGGGVASRIGDPTMSWNRTGTTSATRFGADDLSGGLEETADEKDSKHLKDPVDEVRGDSIVTSPSAGFSPTARQAYMAPSFTHGHHLSHTLSPIEAFQLDSIQERREGPGGSETPYRETLERTLSTEGRNSSRTPDGSSVPPYVERETTDTSPSNSSLEGGHGTGSTGSSRKGKEREMTMPSHQDTSTLGLPSVVDAVHGAPSTTDGGSEVNESSHHDGSDGHRPSGRVTTGTADKPSIDVDGDDDQREHPVTAAMYGSSALDLIDSQDRAQMKEAQRQSQRGS